MTPRLTPRDRLSRLVDLGRKTLRYWWLVAIAAIVGGALSLGFALMKPRRYQSSTTLSYEELIKSDVLTPGREQMSQRAIGDRYRELLMTRTNMAAIIADPALSPFPGEDPETAIDKLRPLVKLETRGGNTLRIVYTDSDPDRAKAVVERLTKLLREKDEGLGNESARRTVEFATQENESASAVLRDREQKLAQFLAQHPEFAQDTLQGASDGAGIRAIRDAPKVESKNPKLRALERQKARIQARLDAPPDEPIRITAPPSPERIAAESAVEEAKRALATATRELESARQRYTEKHPTMINAEERRTAAQQRLRQAQAAVPPAVETQIAPATPQDRAKLETDLDEITAQIARVQSQTGDAPVDSSTERVVELETEHARLRRGVAEQRERVEALASTVFRAQMDASQKLAESSRLAVIDPPFKPVTATGPGEVLILIAGTALFIALGAALALGLGILDDRIFRALDIDEVGVPVLAVIPSATPRKVTRR